MPIAIQTQQITGDGSVTFTFPSEVGMYAYALQYFKLQVQNAQNGSKVIQNIGVTLRPSSDINDDPNSVTLSQTMHLDQVDYSQSYTYVTVVAWLGSDNPPGVVLANQNGIPVDQMMSQTAQPLPTGYPPSYATAAIAGFSFTFATEDSDYLGLGVGVGAASSPYSNTPSISAVASGIWTGDSAFSGTVDAAVIATTSEATDLAFGLSCLLNASPSVGIQVDPLPALGGAGVASAGFLIQSFFTQFDPKLNPTPDLSQTWIGVLPSGISLNDPENGAVIVVSTGQLQCNDYDGDGSTETAQNALVNYLVVECPEAPSVTELAANMLLCAPRSTCPPP
ncbi:MAG: hypothetical protein JWM19_4079 [Actinomycetia bacterium]|nr:hypothetical protein [Actinomycetes bacterium]